MWPCNRSCGAGHGETDERLVTIARFSCVISISTSRSLGYTRGSSADRFNIAHIKEGQENDGTVLFVRT